MPVAKAKVQTNRTPLRLRPAKEDKTQRQKRLESLLNEAMKHPGVADVMKMYQSSVEAEETFSAYQFFQNPFPEMATSSSSEPVLC